MTRILTALGISLTATMLMSASGPKFLNDDPVKVERDTQDASSMTPMELKLVTDLGYNIVKGTDRGLDVRAQNVNTIDEVPDSSWFTNRAGVRPMTADDVAIGPDTTDGPAPGQWTIISSKSDGITPGFVIRDARGDRWFLKFDPRGYRGMTTGTEVAVSKLVWALGYHVPENHIAYFAPEQLTIASEAKFTGAGGRPRQMRMSDVTNMLRQVDREANGTYRVVASKALPGKPVGRLRFFGTRPDDPNDIVPHEHRRELRGYRVFAAWLNHVDTKAINSLDTLITEGGKSFVRHHLIDFGSALGSGGVAPAEYWEGSEYLVEPKQSAKQMIAFGFSYPKWHTMPFYESRAIGRFPAHNADFNPEAWKPRVPNQAFLHARADDKFWAARKIAAIDTDMIRAAVRAGEFGDRAAEEFLVRAIAERRTAIMRTYLAGVNPIADPVLDADGQLTFSNAAVDADVARKPLGYRAVWSKFDNATTTSEQIGESRSGSTTLHAPARLPRTDGAFLKVSLSASGAPHRAWESPVDAYFRLRQGEWRLIGFERIPN
jgi:hypothetical protein